MSLSVVSGRCGRFWRGEYTSKAEDWVHHTTHFMTFIVLGLCLIKFLILWFPLIPMPHFISSPTIGNHFDFLYSVCICVYNYIHMYLYNNVKWFTSVELWKGYESYISIPTISPWNSMLQGHLFCSVPISMEWTMGMKQQWIVISHDSRTVLLVVHGLIYVFAVGCEVF